MHKNGTKKTHRVNRLVAITFIQNPNNYPHVNHLDEQKTNNYSSNLEWITPRDNIRYSLNLHPEKNKGEEHCRAKISNVEANIILKQKGKLSAKELSEKYGFAIGNIHNIWRGETWNSITGKQKHIPLKREKLSPDIINEIYYLAHFTELTHKEIAKLCNVPASTVSNIKYGLNHSKITHHKGQKPAYFEMPNSLNQKLSVLNQQSTTQPVAVDIYSLDYWLGD